MIYPPIRCVGVLSALEPQVEMETVDHLWKAYWVTMINVHSEQSEQHSLWIRVAIIALKAKLAAVICLFAVFPNLFWAPAINVWVVSQGLNALFLNWYRWKTFRVGVTIWEWCWWFSKCPLPIKSNSRRYLCNVLKSENLITPPNQLGLTSNPFRILTSRSKSCSSSTSLFPLKCL